MLVPNSEYLTRVQTELSRYRFFEKEPTPQLLAEAQRKFSLLSIPIPYDDKRNVLPYPTTKAKKDIFNRDQYVDIDNYALKAPTELHSAELSELVSYLLKPAQTDVAKVRVIFRWISGQDLLRYKHIRGAPKDSAATYLNDLKQNKGSYESLFRQMCKYAGIPCEKITGFAKGVSYNVGEDIGDNARNTWNAVLVDKSWRLIDMQWASRQVVTQDKGEWELIDDGTGSKPAKSDETDVSYDIYAYEEFYFLTDPEEFIYSHFPDEKAWQLLARPVTFDEFQKIAYLRSKFFELCMTVMSHPWCVLQAVNGEANLDMGFFSDTMKFSYNLYRSTKVEHKQIQGNVDMDKFLFLETIPDEKTLSVEIFFPTTGKFKAEIFGRDTTETDTVLKWLCTYVFYCETPKTNCRPLPQNPRKEWGPGSDTMNMGMEAITHKRGKINVDDGEVEVKFSLNKDRDFLHKLTTEDNKTLDNYTVHRIENGEVIFHARVPGKGQYMLSIMAKEDDEEGGYPSVCNYLLRCEEEFPPLEPFPEIPNGELGPTDEFKKLGLALVENCSSMVTVDKTGQLVFKMKIPKNVEFFAKLGLLNHGQVEDKTEYVSWYREGEIVTFELRFGQKGSYRFNLFAKPAGQSGGFPRAFSSIIEVHIPMMVAMSFPEKYAGWTDECKLIEPFNKNLPSKDKVDFAAVVPNAKAVAVVGDEWTQLKKDKDGVWKNQVATIEEGKPMFLSAKFDETGNSFSHLLKYEVISKEKMDEIAREQKKAHKEADAEYHERQKMKESLKKKAEEKRKQEAMEKKRRMELQIMEDGEKKQIEERLDFEEGSQTLTSSERDITARRLEEERKKREEDRKKKDEKIRKREADIVQGIRSPSASDDIHIAKPTSYRSSKSADALRDQLMLAMKQKNKINLERAIAECEAAKLPEIESDLYQAKNLLDTLDGPRPGSTRPDILRDQLKRAIIQKDKASLEKAIGEYEASGITSADGDLLKAKNVLDSLGGARAEKDTPFYLRDDLARAIRQKDPKKLDEAIRKCEDAGYPEIGSDIRRARDVLESLGGGRGGTKSPDQLKEKLLSAMDKKDKEKLESAINECIAAGMPELDSSVADARKVLGGLREPHERGPKTPDSLRNQLKNATKLRNKQNLEKAINDAEAAGYPELAYDLQNARDALEKISGNRGGIKTPESVRDELKAAMKEGDEAKLARAIKNATAAGFSELANDVQRARDKLDILRGGRGVTKSPESLKEKLQNAIASKNKTALEQAIKECDAAGYPELAYDLKEARDKLESLGGGRGVSKSPESLRNKLLSATRQRDPNAIEKAINECVAAGQPELARDIQQARDVLNNIEGAHKVPKSPPVLRDQLENAVKQGNIAGIERAIAEAEASKSPELSKNIQQARSILDSLKRGQRVGSLSPEQVGTLVDQIQTSIFQRDRPSLEKAIAEAEPHRHPQLEPQIQKARPLLDALNIKEKLETAFLTDNKEDIHRCVIEIEQKNLTDYLSVEVSEARSRIRGHAAPDPAAFFNRDDVSIDARTGSRMGWYSRSSGFAHDLLISAIVVLGEYERNSETYAWRNYQHFFDLSNTNGSSRRVLAFDLDQIYQNLSSRADEILMRNSTDEVQLMNRSGQMSYSWSRTLDEQMSSYFTNLNGTINEQSSYSESQFGSQTTDTTRTERRTSSGSQDSSQAGNNANVYRTTNVRRSAAAMSETTTRNGTGMTPFYSQQRKY
ncbi:uncharacterized protein LOC115214248 isoform X1 [Argonauta hians]